MKTYKALLFGLLAALPIAVSAQDSSPAILAKNLHAPRHLFLTDEALYIAEAGVGGENQFLPGFGGASVGVGTSGQITRFDQQGTAVPFITGLFSSFSEVGITSGPTAFSLTEDAAWVLIGEGLSVTEENGGWTLLGEGNANILTETKASALLKYSVDGKTLEETFDLLAYEAAENPDGGLIASNPLDFVIAADGSIYVADAGANTVLKIVDGEISTFAVWQAIEEGVQAAPSSLELDASGNLYVGFMTGYLYPKAGAWVEKFSSEGESLERYDGLTGVVDIDLDDEGTLYAVEFTEFFEFTERGPEYSQGLIVKVTDKGVETVITGLKFPYGFMVNSDGTFTVANGTDHAYKSQLLLLNPGDTAPATEIDYDMQP